MRAAGDHGHLVAGRRELGGQVAADRAGAENANTQGLSSPIESGRRLPRFQRLAYGVFFAGSPDGLDVEPEPAPVAPDWSLDELEPEDDGEDGAGLDGVAGLVLRLGLELEDGLDGDMPPEVLPEPAGRSAPRSQAAIRLAPRARETATAKV
jgi:hypothetical protein